MSPGWALVGSQGFAGLDRRLWSRACGQPAIFLGCDPGHQVRQRSEETITRLRVGKERCVDEAPSLRLNGRGGPDRRSDVSGEALPNRMIGKQPCALRSVQGTASLGDR